MIELRNFPELWVRIQQMKLFSNFQGTIAERNECSPSTIMTYK